MATQESLSSAFSAMLGGLPSIEENMDEKTIEEVKTEDRKKEAIPDKVAPETSESPALSDLIQKKPTVELRNKRKQFMLTGSMCEKLKQYSLEYGISENEIICQLISRLP